MDNNTAPKPFSRKDARQRRLAKKGFVSEFKMWVTTLRDAAGFLFAIGILLICTGMICFMGFHGNTIGHLFIDMGMVLFLIGMFTKVIDIFLKIIGVSK